MELMTYKTRALRTLSLLILVALIAALNPPSLTDSTAFAQATAPELTSSADTANQVDLSWTAVEDADDYELWRWEDVEGWVELDDSISGTSHTDSGVTAGKTYYYQVSADGGTTWSNRVNETVGAYDASTLDAPTATSTAISLSWSAVTGAASYELWRYENNWTQVGGTITEPTTTYADASVEIGKTYFYQVMAKGPNGDGAWSNRVSAVVPSTTPGAPLNFSATPGDAQATLSWDAPATNGGSAITGYQYRYQMSGGSWSSWMATSPALARTATVSSLTNESDYNFEVRAQNANGDGPAAADSAMPMSTVPDTPMSFGSTSTGPTEIALSWDAVTGAVSYQLQRRTNGGEFGAPMDAGSGTTYTDMGLTPSTTYDYEVRSVNAAGASPWSGVVTVSTTGPEAPDAVSDLSATASADKITLMWTMPDSNGAAITGYDLDVSDDGSDWSDLSSPAAGDTSYDHMSLDPGTMNYYRIRAMNSVGYGDWSAAMSATVAAVAPGKPSLTATADGTTITLSWVAPADTGGAAITGYTIQVSSTGTSGWRNLANKAADATSHDHTVLAPGTTRYYQISARNSAGTSDWSDVASATTAGAEPPPPPPGGAPDSSSPRGLNVSSDDLDAAAPQGTSTTSLTLTWLVPTDPPDDDEAGTTLEYEVEKWTPSSQTWADVDETDAADLTLTDSGLMGTTNYTYRVRAVDGTVEGTWSKDESGETVAVSPSKPALTATKMGTDKVVLTWTVPDDGGDDIVGYVIQVRDSTTSDFSAGDSLNAMGEVNSAASVMLEAAQVSVTHSGLVAGETWHYRISALNGVADISDLTSLNAAWSEWSDEASATTDMGAPGAPDLSIDNSTAGSLIVSWTAPSNTGGAAIDSYELHEWVEADQDWTIIQDTTTLNFTRDGLAGNVMRYYRVRAKNSNGAGPWDEASGTTLAGVPSAPKLTSTVNGPNRITLSWTTPNNGGSDITGYVIEISTTDTADGSFSAVDDTTGTGLTDLSASTLSATHTGLEAGTTRHYRVYATNGETGTNLRSNVVSATTTTGGVPGAPIWATESPSATTSTVVNLEWTAPQVDGNDDTSVTGYDIAVWENGNWIILSDSPVAANPTEYNHDERSGATTYYYSVRARNANGPGPWSAMGDVTTADGAPSKPELTVTPDGPDKIKLSWNRPDDGGDPIVAYLVQVSNSRTAGWGPLDPTGSNTDLDTEGMATPVTAATGEPAPPLTVTHTGLSGRMTKYYRVRAANGDNTNAAQRGPWSEVMSATTPAGEPAMVVLNDPPDAEMADEITIAWAAPANGGSSITGYQIQVWEDGAWMGLMSVGGSVTSYTHEDLPGSTTNHYRVRAMNAVGDGPWSSTLSRTTVAGRPGAPVLNASANGTSEIRLTWTIPAAGGGTLSEYDIQYSINGTSGWTWDQTGSSIQDGLRVLRTADADSRNYSHRNLDPATIRHYRVRAVNENGVGPWSNVAMAMTTGGKPGRPGLMASASGGTMINLSWTAPAGDGGSPITGYEIEYWDGSNGWMDLVMPAAGAISHTDRNLAGGSTKYYRIRAINAAGEGAWSTIAHATTETSVPSPPTLTAVADGATKIKLTWMAGADGGLPITAYYLQHSSRMVIGRRVWSDLGDPMSNMMMMSTEDTGLTGGTTKYYRVRAENSNGFSGWSPLASAMTARSVPGRPSLDATGLARGRILLDWEAADGGSTIIRYEIQKWDSAKRRWVDVSRTTGTTYTDSGLDAGKRYYYRVRAVNGMGDGPWSTFDYASPTLN